MTRFLFIALCFLAVTLPEQASADVAERLNPLVTLMIQRLQLSREVAWSKCRAGIPVADPAREARMLTDLKAAGSQVGLSPSEVTRLFLPQIAASRRYQEELIAGWRTGMMFPRSSPSTLPPRSGPALTK